MTDHVCLYRQNSLSVCTDMEDPHPACRKVCTHTARFTRQLKNLKRDANLADMCEDMAREFSRLAKYVRSVDRRTGAKIPEDDMMAFVDTVQNCHLHSEQGDSTMDTTIPIDWCALLEWVATTRNGVDQSVIMLTVVFRLADLWQHRSDFDHGKCEYLTDLRKELSGGVHTSTGYDIPLLPVTENVHSDPGCHEQRLQFPDMALLYERLAAESAGGSGVVPGDFLAAMWSVALKTLGLSTKIAIQMAMFSRNHVRCAEPTPTTLAGLYDFFGLPKHQHTHRTKVKPGRPDRTKDLEPPCTHEFVMRPHFSGANIRTSVATAMGVEPACYRQIFTRMCNFYLATGDDDFVVTTGILDGCISTGAESAGMDCDDPPQEDPVDPAHPDITHSDLELLLNLPWCDQLDEPNDTGVLPDTTHVHVDIPGGSHDPHGTATPHDVTPPPGSPVVLGNVSPLTFGGMSSMLLGVPTPPLVHTASHIPSAQADVDRASATLMDMSQGECEVDEPHCPVPVPDIPVHESPPSPEQRPIQDAHVGMMERYTQCMAATPLEDAAEQAEDDELDKMYDSTQESEHDAQESFPDAQQEDVDSEHTDTDCDSPRSVPDAQQEDVDSEHTDTDCDSPRHTPKYGNGYATHRNSSV